MSYSNRTESCPLCGTALIAERSADTVRRARTLIERSATGAVERTIRALVAQVRSYPERLLAKRDGVSYFIPVKDIDWIEASRNLVRLHVGPELHSLRATTKDLEATLDYTVFWRINRSTIVNIVRIKEIHARENGHYAVTLADGTRLRMTERYRRRRSEFSSNAVFGGLQEREVDIQNLE